MLYLSVLCAHTVIKHKPTDLEHVKTEQPANNTELKHMRTQKQMGRRNKTVEPDHENVDCCRFCCGWGLKYHKTWRERARKTLRNVSC